MLEYGKSYRITEETSLLPKRTLVGEFIEYQVVDNQPLARFKLSDDRMATLFIPDWDFEELSELEALLW